MIWKVSLLITLVVWIITYVKNKKAILALPYLLMLFITPIYNILDQKVFVKIFGCGCVPVAQTNVLNIDFNANDLRFWVYLVLTVLICILGIFLSKKITKKKFRIIYIITIALVNLVLSYKICQLYMWG